MDILGNQPLFDPQKISQQLTKYISDVTLEVRPETVDSLWATRIYRAERDNRQFNREFVTHLRDGNLFLIAESPRSQVEDSPTTFIWF